MQRSDLGALVDYVWTNIKAAAQTVVEAGWVKHFVASCLVGAGVLAYLAAEHPSYALNARWPLKRQDVPSEVEARKKLGEPPPIQSGFLFG